MRLWTNLHGYGTHLAETVNILETGIIAKTVMDMIVLKSKEKNDEVLARIQC